ARLAEPPLQLIANLSVSPSARRRSRASARRGLLLHETGQLVDCRAEETNCTSYCDRLPLPPGRGDTRLSLMHATTRMVQPACERRPVSELLDRPLLTPLDARAFCVLGRVMFLGRERAPDRA